MTRLRVVFSIGAMHGGGSERQIVHLLSHLDRSRFEPFLYLVSRTGPLLKDIPSDVPVTSFEERVAASKLYLPGLMHSRRVRDFAKFLTEAQADISYDRTFLMTLVAAAGAQRVGVPNVSTIVTNPETGFAPVAGRFGWLKRRMLRTLYNNSAQVLAVSNGARASAIRFYGLRGDNVSVHRNGVDVARIQKEMRKPIHDEWWTGPVKQGRAGPVIRIVSAGRLNHEKGFHILIDAISRLSANRPFDEFRVALIGDGPDRDQLTARIRARQLDDVVRLPGFQSNAMAWFRSADLFVLPSLVEGMPNVLLEAIACGTPVISTDCQSGPAEILDGGRLGTLVSVNDVEALADAINSLVPILPRTSKTAMTALNEVTAHWSVEASTRGLEAILVQTHRLAATGR